MHSLKHPPKLRDPSFQPALLSLQTRTPVCCLALLRYAELFVLMSHTGQRHNLSFHWSCVVFCSQISKEFISSSGVSASGKSGAPASPFWRDRLFYQKVTAQHSCHLHFARAHLAHVKYTQPQTAPGCFVVVPVGCLGFRRCYRIAQSKSAAQVITTVEMHLSLCPVF